MRCTNCGWAITTDNKCGCWPLARPCLVAESMACPTCGSECIRDEVDIGVGVQYGPLICTECGWAQGEDTQHQRLN